MFNIGYTARVGFVVIAAIILIGYTYVFFRREQLSSHTYTLYVLSNDATGITKNSIVQMAGVKVGTVDNISIDKTTLQARLTLTMMNDGKTPMVPVGSHFIINIPVLGAVGTLDIVPPQGGITATTRYYNNDDVIPNGQRAVDLQASMASANELMQQIKVTLTEVDKLIKDTSAFVNDPKIQGGLRNTLGNFEEASKNGLILTKQLNVAVQQDNAQVAALLRDTHKTANLALTDIKSTTSDIRGVMAENRQNLNDIIANMRDTTAALQGITASANSALNEGGVGKNLSAIVANLKDTTAKLSTMAADLQKVTGDASVQNDLKATVHNLKQTSDETAALVGRINQIIGTKPVNKTADQPGAPSTGTSSYNIFPQPRIDMIQNTRDSRFRMDLNAYLPMNSKGDFVTGGIFGFGDNNKLNLQYGTLAGADKNLSYRYGLHASKLGLGADYKLAGPYSLSLDLYDPNNSKLDIHGSIMLSPSLGLILGSDNFTHRSSGIIGVQYRP